MLLDPASTAWLNAVTAGHQVEARRLGLVLDTADQLDASNRDVPGQLATAAHVYADAGIPVFPVEPRGKRPLTAHGFKDATLDHPQIDAWWERWSDANIGLPTGHLFDVIDVDGLEGMAAMYGGAPAMVDDFNVIAVALTSRDGGRHLYIPPTGRPNGTALVPGVDFRGVGGYVVAPPSLSVTGRRYQWVIDLPPLVAA